MTQEKSEIYKQVKNNLDATYNFLLDKDINFAIKYSNWCITKLIESHADEIYDELFKVIKSLQEKKALKDDIQKIVIKRNKYAPQNYPKNLDFGDIVYVNYGKGYCTELSDYHFSVILSDRVGSQYLIAPLTSEKPKGKVLSYNDLQLNDIETSYVSLNQIRFISYRRLKNIPGIPNGRKNINVIDGQDRVKEILDAFNERIRLKNKK